MLIIHQESYPIYIYGVGFTKQRGNINFIFHCWSWYSSIL